MVADLRRTARSLRKSPAFASIVVVTLALGIGANTAIFSIVNELLLNPSGIAEPSRIVAVRVKYDKLNLKSIGTSVPDFADVRDSRDIFASAATFNSGAFSYSGSGDPERWEAANVTVEFFDVFGVKPAYGRVFRPEEDAAGANHSVILSDALWRRRFAADPSIVGQTITLNLKPYRVVGIMPASFAMPQMADVWAPMGFRPESFNPRNRHNQFLSTVARLKPGISRERAASHMQLLTSRVLDHQDPQGYAKNSAWGLFIVPFTEANGPGLKAQLFVLMGAVGFVLLIACANIAGLMLARASGRAREIAVRAALGAGRWRLIREQLIDSLLLSLVGAGLGFGLARLLVHGLLASAPDELKRNARIGTDHWVLLFTLGAAIVAALLFGLMPAWQVARIGQYEVLKEGGRSAAGGRARQRMRSLLVVGEVALSLVLLVGAGLMIRSLGNLHAASPGFQTKGVMTASYAITPRATGAAEKQRNIAFHKAIVDGLEAAPGVESAAVVTPLPFSGDNWAGGFVIEGRQLQPGDPGPHGDVRYITPSYFKTLRIPVLRGRAFNDQDREGSDPVTIVDTTLARQYWGGGDPLGKRIRRGNGPWTTIVGIAGHVQHNNLMMDSGKGVYYFPMYQRPTPYSSVVVKTTGNAVAMTPIIRQTVRYLDPSQPLHHVMTMEDRLKISLAPQRYITYLLGLFAGVALLMAAVGLYGVVSYSVSQRTQEIGVRMALGAERGSVLGLVVRQGMWLAGAGLFLGVGAAVVLARAARSQLYQVSPVDPLTFVLVCAGLAGVALLASIVPARRAASVDPVVALRAE